MLRGKCGVCVRALPHDEVFTQQIIMAEMAPDSMA